MFNIMDINPFENDISNPRGKNGIEESVTGLNDNVLNKLLQQFEKINAPSITSLKAQLVLSRQAGYGKSHLIGRLFSKLTQNATLVYLTPFLNPATCWKSILIKTVQELRYPDNFNSKDNKVASYKQLEAFAHGILVNLLVSGLESGKIRTRTKQAILDFLHSKTILEFRANKKMLTYVQKNIDGLERIFIQELRRRNINLNVSSESSWYRVLFTYAYLPSNNDIAVACLDWLNGGSITPQEAQMIGIRINDIPNSGMSGDEANDLCQKRVLDLCSLATFFRPFVFCFDQTEAYGKAELAAAFGEVIQTLVDYCPNQMTVITANQHPWLSTIQLHMELAYLDRLTIPPDHLELESLNKQQALELIEHRLTSYGLDAVKADFISDGKWIEDELKKITKISVREFLHVCRSRWDGKGNEDKIEAMKANEDTTPQLPLTPSIDELYSTFISERKAQPKRLDFDPDVLYWTVYEAPKGLANLAIESYNGRNDYLTVQWRLNGQHIYFGFEEGSNSVRWQAIAREANRLYATAANINIKIVMLRTHELRQIPVATWTVIAPLIEDAKRKFLRILRLEHPDKDPTLVNLYAAYDLHSKAVSGDISFTPAAVLDFIRGKLQPFWDLITAPITQPPPPSDKKLAIEIRGIVERERFLSIDELMKKLSTPVSKELCQQTCEEIREIKIHRHPNVVVLQCQLRQ
ncbi:MAG: hypothetical protein HQL06_14160 [Nitrospirae bacterium]|nr:hypothetical protein [Nitrospirota bacterium]